MDTSICLSEGTSINGGVLFPVTQLFGMIYSTMDSLGLSSWRRTSGIPVLQDQEIGTRGSVADTILGRFSSEWLFQDSRDAGSK